MKKFSFPKIQFLTKKNKNDGPLWKISTKVHQARADILVKSRTNKKPRTYYFFEALKWLKNYFKAVGWLFLGGLIILGLIVLFTTPIFFLKPEKIEVVLRPEPVFDKNAITSILRDFSGKNIFSITTKDIFTSLSENIRHIASVEKTLLLPDGLRVTVTSFPASYRAFIGEEKFLLTENGQLIPDIPEVEVPAVQIYHLIQDTSVSKKTPISDRDMYNIGLALQKWRNTLPSLPINELKFYDQEKEIHIVTNKTRCIFLLENASGQIDLMEKMIAQGHIVVQRQKYIDMRMQNRIYTCAETEGACNINIKNIYGN